MHFSLTDILIACVPFLLQFALFVRWMYRRMRDEEIMRAFVRDVALNHLPHIYSALRQIAAQQGIDLEDPPLVQFLDLDGKSRPGPQFLGNSRSRLKTDHGSSTASMALPSRLVALARDAAAAHSLDPTLVCAVIEQESGWNPWAMRYEPDFFKRYVAPLYTNNKVSASEAYARGFSWGLMQVMGQVAREAGFDAPFLSALCDPEQGLAVGCLILQKKLAAAGGDFTRGLLAWNGGANPSYAAAVLGRRGRYL